MNYLQEYSSSHLFLGISSFLCIASAIYLLKNASKKYSSKSSKDKKKRSKDDSNNIVKSDPVNWTYLSSSKSNVQTENSASASYRGYKTTGDGKLTTYFHRELSEEDKKVIGDNSPRKIESTGSELLIDTSPRLLSTSNQSASAWNSAGTWEEKNITAKTCDKLKSLLKEIVIEGTPPEMKNITIKKLKITVTSVNNITGDSIIAIARGKKKFIYDLQTSLSWKMVFKSSQNDSKEIIIYGSTIIIDISAENNPEINHTLTGVVDNIAKGFYKDFIQNSKSNFSLQRRIVLACSRLLEDLKSEY